MKVNCSDCCTAAAYGVYILGGSVLVGLARLAVTVAFIAKHVLYSAVFTLANQQEQKNINVHHLKEAESRKSENAQAEKETANAKGLAKVGAFVKEKAIKTKNTVKEVSADIDKVIEKTSANVQTNMILTKEETQRKSWNSEGIRSLIELIPVFGAVYQTYKDYHDTKHYTIIKPGIFGIALISAKLESSMI
jgi:hypothetical protein